MTEHAYDPICGCHACVTTSASYGIEVKHPKMAEVVALPPKPPGEVIYVDFKTRKRVL